MVAPLIYNPGQSRKSLDKYIKMESKGEKPFQSYTDIFSDTTIEAIYNKTIDNLWDLLRTPEEFRDSTITVVYGASENVEIPLKITAYLVPIIKILINLNTHGLGLPHVKVIYASGAGIYINQYEEQPVIDRGQRIFNILSDFISTFYPDLKHAFSFENDNVQGYQESELFKSLNRDVETIKDQTSIQVIETIKKFGERRGQNEQSIYQYIATHPIVFGDIICPEIIDHKATGFKISIGGYPERLFGVVRYALAQEQAKNRQDTIQLLTSIGRSPIYYSSKPEACFGGIKGGDCKDLTRIYGLVVGGEEEYIAWAHSISQSI